MVDTEIGIIRNRRRRRFILPNQNGSTYSIAHAAVMTESLISYLVVTYPPLTLCPISSTNPCPPSVAKHTHLSNRSRPRSSRTVRAQPFDGACVGEDVEFIGRKEVVNVLACSLDLI